MTWRPLPGDEDSTHQMRDLLDKLSRKLGGASVTTTTQAFSSWAEAVGPQIAQHTKPIALKADVLIVEVDDARWATQLQWLSSRVVKKLNELSGETSISKLEVRLKRS